MVTYTVIEKQVNDQGQQSILQQGYTEEEENQALSDVFMRLASAAISTIPYHSAHVLKFDGKNVFITAGMAFDRSEPEPEPEPVEE